MVNTAGGEAIEPLHTVTPLITKEVMVLGVFCQVTVIWFKTAFVPAVFRTVSFTIFRLALARAAVLASNTRLPAAPLPPPLPVEVMTKELLASIFTVVAEA
jgi:hypothetical protein